MLKKHVIEKLNLAWKEKQLLNISGVNSFGEPFSTQGVLNDSYGANMGIFPRTGTILLELEPVKINGKKTLKFIAPFETEFKDDNNLIILKISTICETIFKNPNKDEILEKAELHKQETEQKLKSEGRDFVVDCPVVSELMNRIGKPVVLDNDYGVVLSVKGSDMFNNPIAYLSKDLRVEECIVVGESCLYTNNMDKELVLTVENDPYQFWCDTKFEDIKIINQEEI